MFLIVLTLSHYIKFKHTSLLLVFAMFLLSFNFINLRQTDAITFQSNAEIIKTFDLRFGVNLKMFGSEVNIAAKPIYLSLLILISFVHRKELRKLFIYIISD